MVPHLAELEEIGCHIMSEVRRYGCSDISFISYRYRCVVIEFTGMYINFGEAIEEIIEAVDHPAWLEFEGVLNVTGEHLMFDLDEEDQCY